VVVLLHSAASSVREFQLLLGFVTLDMVCFYFLATLCVKFYITEGLTWISETIGDVEHVFVCLLHIYVCSSLLPVFSVGIFVFWLQCIGVSHIPWTQELCQTDVL
jgi:hypothetical protein